MQNDSSVKIEDTKEWYRTVSRRAPRRSPKLNSTTVALMSESWSINTIGTGTLSSWSWDNSASHHYLKSQLYEINMHISKILIISQKWDISELDYRIWQRNYDCTNKKVKYHYCRFTSTDKVVCSMTDQPVKGINGCLMIHHPEGDFDSPVYRIW